LGFLLVGAGAQEPGSGPWSRDPSVNHLFRAPWLAEFSGRIYWWLAGAHV